MGSVTLDFSTMKPLPQQDSGVTLDFSKIQPLNTPPPAAPITPEVQPGNALTSGHFMKTVAANAAQITAPLPPPDSILGYLSPMRALHNLGAGTTEGLQAIHHLFDSAGADATAGMTPEQRLQYHADAIANQGQQQVAAFAKDPVGAYVRSAGQKIPGAIIGSAVSAGLSRALSPQAIVPGENYTPTQLKAHTGILGRMNGLGDNFIPQDSAASTGSVIRQAAADNPAIAQAATAKGSTTGNIAALQAILQKANTALEAPHAATIAQHASVPADVTGVQSAVGQSFPSTLAGVSPEDAAAIQQLQQRLGTVNTLGGLNDLRQWLNDEAAAGYKQDGVAASRGTATKAGIRTAADSARNAYYDQLQQASGVDFRPLKAQQSALLDQQEGAAKLGQTLSAQQAIADEPKSPGARAGEVLTGGRALKAGPLAGAAQLATEKLLRQTPLTQPNYLIRKFLSSLPDPTPQAPQTAATLPTTAPRLPANASPQMVQGTPVPPAVPLASFPPAIQKILALTRGGQ